MGGFQGQTAEYRWPVVAVAEPVDVRTIRGYVTILEQQAKDGTLLSRRVMFSDPEGRPFQSLAVEDFDVFNDAAQAALVEMGLRSAGGDGDRADAGDIIR